MTKMSVFREAFAMLKFEFQRELSGKYSMLSVLLYGFSLTYFIYFLLNTQGGLVNFETKYWNVIFWILIMFSIINVLITHFSQDSRNSYLYYYTLFSAEGFLIGKLIFYIIYSAIISTILYLIFILWLGNPVMNFGLFYLILLFGSMTFTILFSLTTALANFQKNSAVLSTILGLPLAIPLVTIVSKLCRESFFATPSDNFLNNFVILVGFNLLMIVLSVILYPFIWRE